MRPIAITGMGCVTPCGKSTSELWGSLIEGRSGIAAITRFPLDGFDVGIGGEIPSFDPTEHGINRKDARRMSLYVQYAVAAAGEALAQAALPHESVPQERVGCIVGTGMGGLRRLEVEMDVLRKRGPSRVSPLLVPSGTPDVPPGEISMRFGFKGPSFAVCTACSSGSDAVIAAARCLADGTADIVVAGGSEETISELAISTFTNLGALARRNEDPAGACRPFDLNRSGFVLGEGAGIIVLESEESAGRRGVPILARLVGYGQTTDAYHKTAPDPTGAGAARAIRLALDSAGIRPQELGYINAHGTGTSHNDQVETLAIKSALGSAAYDIPISSTKSMTGHLIGGAGAVEAIVAIQALRTSLVPPTINYETPDPQCDLNYVPNRMQRSEVEYALTNSFGFGGHNSSLLLAPGDDR